MKFMLTEKSKKVKGIKVYQIKALRDIPLHSVKAGDVGGFVSSEGVISQEGDAWIAKRGTVIHESETQVCIKGDTLLERGFIYNSVIDIKKRIYCKEILDSTITGDNILIEGLLSIHSSCIQAVGRIVIYKNAKIINSSIFGNDILVGSQAVVENTEIRADDLELNGKKIVVSDSYIKGDNIKFVSPFVATNSVIKGKKINIGDSHLKESVILGEKIRIRGLTAVHANLELDALQIKGQVSINNSKLLRGKKVKLDGDIEIIDCHSEYSTPTWKDVTISGHIYLKHAMLGEKIKLNGIVELIGIKKLESICLISNITMDGVIYMEPDKTELSYFDETFFGDYVKKK